jgi:ADP-ribose pyrophosphatase
MTEDSPVWKRISKKHVYKGRAQIIEHEAVLPNGERATHEVVHADGKAVAVLIKTPDNEIVLAHEYRFPLDRWIYDLPGGGSPANEDFEEAAIRECREEVGIRPKKLTKLATVFPNPNQANWNAHLYFCEDFEASELRLNDPSEVIEKILMPIADLDKLIRSQEIIDPLLLIAWYTAKDQGFIKV